jgi:hypothetical protein
LFRVLLCRSLCYKLSPFQALGKVTLPRIVRPACLFTVHVGGGSSPLSCAVFLPLPLSQAFLLLLTGRCCCSCQTPCLFTVHVGSGSSPLSRRVFLPPPLSPAFTLLVAGYAPCPHSRQSLSGLPGLFIYSLFTVPGRIPFPQSSVLSVPHPLSHVLFVLIAYYSVSLFSPGGGQSVQGAILLWPRLVCGRTAVPRSSPGPRLPKPSGRG